MRTFYLVFGLTFFLSSNLFSQDTIKLGPSYYYTSEEYPIRGKSFAANLKCAREDIIYSENHKRIENCYYYDNKRNCGGITYKIIADSILHMSDSSYNYFYEESWGYNKIEGKYIVTRFNDDFLETVIVDSLMPFPNTGIIMVTTVDKLDTLWIEDYRNCDDSNSRISPKYIYPKRKVKGKIYSIEKVDHPPTFIDKTPLPQIINNKNEFGCYSEPFIMVLNMIFIVTSTGEIENIEIGIGNVDVQRCPYYYLDLLKTIKRFGKLKPALKNGKPVNVRYILDVKTN